MANSEAKQSNSIYYNIDIYNDNATGADISSKFSTAFNTPLLMDTSNYEVAVARARIPLDQIPLSQENIPFHKWQIEIGVPIIGGGYTYYNSYVPQFLPTLIPYTNNTAVIGINNQTLNYATISSIDSPTGNVPVVISTSPNPAYQEILTNIAVNNTISNIAYTLNYICSCSFTIVSRFTYDGVFVDSVDIRSFPVENPQSSARIIGVCGSQLSDELYVLTYLSEHSSWQIYQLYNPAGWNGVEMGGSVGAGYPVNISIYSFSCSSNYLTVSCTYLDVPAFGSIFNYSLPQTHDSPPQWINQDWPPVNPSITYIDNNDNYYVYPFGFPQFHRSDLVTLTTEYESFNILSFPNYTAIRFLGSDTWNNLLLCYKSVADNTYSIVAYNKTTGGDGVYTIQMGTQEPVSLSQFISVSGFNLLPSLSPNYQVMTINDYLRQINMGFVDVFNQIPQPYSSPTIAPRLVFDSATSIVSIVCDPGCPSSLTTACVINFNQLLWSLFKFNSIAAVYTALPPIGGVVRTLEIDDVASGATLSITPQPNSTLYRFSDLTRIIIGTTRMGVYGDNQNNDKLLVNIGDFTVDTENGIPNLIIYNPFILRFYKLYQNTPLTNIDVFVSYANRAGEVFPITISPYNSIGLKLEFQRIPMTTQ